MRAMLPMLRRRLLRLLVLILSRKRRLLRLRLRLQPIPLIQAALVPWQWLPVLRRVRLLRPMLARVRFQMACPIQARRLGLRLRRLRL
jgi:hypothetical protein